MTLSAHVDELTHERDIYERVRNARGSESTHHRSKIGLKSIFISSAFSNVSHTTHVNELMHPLVITICLMLLTYVFVFHSLPCH